LPLVFDTRTSAVLTIKHTKNRTTIHLPLYCFSAICHTRAPNSRTQVARDRDRLCNATCTMEKWEN